MHGRPVPLRPNERAQRDAHTGRMRPIAETWPARHRALPDVQEVSSELLQRTPLRTHQRRLQSGRGKVHQVLLQRGWIEKVKNPAFQGILNPWQIMQGGEPEPQHLFRLTEAGLKVRAALPVA